VTKQRGQDDCVERSGVGATGVRRAVTLVVVLNLAYFGVEFAVASRIGSVSLFADSIDFLEDAAVNTLLLLGLAWSARKRAKLAMVPALVLLLPGIATVCTAWQHWLSAHVRKRHDSRFIAR
jgi:Co/Zn/Cd efflux system component